MGVKDRIYAGAFLLGAFLSQVVVGQNTVHTVTQSTVDGNGDTVIVDAAFLANQLVGTADLTASNAFMTGPVECMGMAAITSDLEWINAFDGPVNAVVLSSGQASYVLGASTADPAHYAFYTGGDLDLEALAPLEFVTYDACVLQFDLAASKTGNVGFHFVFASREYPDYVNTAFNDVFAFLVRVKGSTSAWTNIATLDGTTLISINSVNIDLNSEYYVQNHDGSLAMAYGGRTIEIQTSAYEFLEGTTYEVKLAIADRADQSLDSVVLLAGSSFTYLPPPGEENPIYIPLDCAGATPLPGALWPPNNKMVNVLIGGLNGENTTVVIETVFQDEPVTKVGKKRLADAAIIDGIELYLRAQRLGNGNGRVYHVSFTASDDYGDSCSGQVTVCVGHDRSASGQLCIDDGPLYDSVNV